MHKHLALDDPAQWTVGFNKLQPFELLSRESRLQLHPRASCALQYISALHRWVLGFNHLHFRK